MFYCPYNESRCCPVDFWIPMTYIVWAKTVEIFSKCLLWCSTKDRKAFTFKIKWGWINDEPGGSKRFDRNFLKTTAIVCSTTLFGQGTNGNHRSRNWPSIVFNVTLARFNFLTRERLGWPGHDLWNLHYLSVANLHWGIEEGVQFHSQSNLLSQGLIGWNLNSPVI